MPTGPAQALLIAATAAGPERSTTMYPDPTALAQMHVNDLRREAAEARRAATLLRATREGTEKSAPSFLVRIRSPRRWAPARLHQA
jgi:3-methyladenine DNA glycosylase/8-oxoguanine DNA glycosylase